MEQNNASDEGRTENKRFTDSVDAEKLIVGDRIAPQLVASTPGQLGEIIKPSHPEGDNPPKTQLVRITQTKGLDDTHSAILADPETGVMVRASCHDSSSAWSQKERDWKVHDIGTDVSVTEVHDVEYAENDETGDDNEYVQGWAEIVLVDKANGHFDYSDEISLGGSTLKLRDVDGRKATATISLEE